MSYEFRKQGGAEIVGGILSKVSNGSLVIPIAFIMVALWINGTDLWGPDWESGTAMAYLLMFAIVLGLSRNRSSMLLSQIKLGEGAKNFFIGFLLMFAGLIVVDHLLLGGSLSSRTIVSSAVYPAIALHAFYVAPVEESLFRGVLKEYTKNWRVHIIPLSMIITSGLFAITHWAMYGGQMMPLWWAFIMGCVFYTLTNLKLSKLWGPLGVPGAIGAHTAYNLAVLGILTGGIV